MLSPESQEDPQPPWGRQFDRPTGVGTRRPELEEIHGSAEQQPSGTD
jgi:hypothetical protein